MVVMILETVIQYRSNSLNVSKLYYSYCSDFQIKIDCSHEVTDQPQSTGVAPVRCSLASTIYKLH